MQEKNNNDSSKKALREKGKISSFKDVLYSRKNKFTPYQRRNLKEKQDNNNLNKNWSDVEEEFSKPREELLYSIERKRVSIFMIFLIFSVIFFIGAISYAFFYLTLNKEEIVQEVEMSVIGPNTVNSGTAFDFNVKLENNTRWDFENINISVEYPESTLDGNSKGPIRTSIIKIDRPLYSGGVINKKFNIILSGIIGDQKDIKITTIYNTLGYSNTISLTKIYQVGIDSSPVSLEMTYPQKTLSEKEFIIDLDVLSNTNIDLKPLILIASLPQGFTMTSSSVDPIFQNNSILIFKTDEIKPGDKNNIKIIGTLTGQNEEKKIFNFEVGDINPETNEIRTTFAKIDKEIVIKKPDLEFNVTINDSSDPEYIAYTNEELSLQLSLTNNLDSIVSDLKLEASIIGDAYDSSNLQIEHGHYNSNKKTITWDKNTWDKFKALNKQETVEDEFLIKIKDLEHLAGYVKNPDVKLHFVVSGVNFNSPESEGLVVSEFDVNIKTASHIKIGSGITFFTGPFENSGPIPPTVGKKTTYTAVWQIYNSTNTLNDVMVTAKLPYYVEFLGNIKPEKYYVTYEPETREVTWRLKKIEPYIGYRTDPKTMHFQIAIIPSANQSGSILDLVGPKKIIATDTFIETQILANQKDSDTTELKSDPNVDYKAGRVVSE